jgi:hypothetical protein
MFVLAGAVVFASTVGAVAGCLSLNRRGSNVEAGTSTPSPSVPDAVATTGPPDRSEPTRPTTPTTPATRKTTKPAETGPRIVSFTIVQRPQCPQGTSEYPVAGAPVIVEWEVTGADEVTLSVDGPGVYGTYARQGRQEFEFPCSGEPGDTVKHTYLLKTVGGGPVKSKTLTATAEVYEVARP